MRHLSTVDRLIQGISFVSQTKIDTDAEDLLFEYHPEYDQTLSAADKQTAGRLMRVNHCGEICAQGLYFGQALGGYQQHIIDEMNQSAQEEKDHFNWCLKRLEQLHSQPSRLAAIWYMSSVCIGYTVARCGDKHSLGFLEETERQVSEHLIEYLNYLPEDDLNSRLIMEKMYADEVGHSEKARQLGARRLSMLESVTMKITAWVMKAICY
ncbi:MAG: demethoxyubiquinone hydroxylase family protein [Legionellales bacterium]|nr:demethoxyubiquinone hydroxylase family protein [Legionellales bacterium]|tara:strand:+ start:2057 stop:2686 length:630 start_codon:yes stop_codon:yes gene_type:complete